jgi:geranylgeranyl pyrophosphate synthase
VATAGLDATESAALSPVLDAMRTELLDGQYMDLLSTGTLTGDVEAALTVIRYKTGKYTVQRPLQLGALLARPDRQPGLDEAGAAEIRQILTATGSRATIEDMIVDRRDRALSVLETGTFHPAGAATLRHLATSVTQRDR